jgi:hypothetical protein
MAAVILRPDLMAKLTDVACANGRSVSSEIELRLQRSLEREMPFPGGNPEQGNVSSFPGVAKRGARRRS